MTDAILNLAHDLISSPWIYPLIFGIAMLDGFFPVVPSETLVITSAALAAAAGEPNALLVLPAAAGAVCGDHVSYWMGRGAGSGLKDGKAFRWARNAVAERGGAILVAARYIPGGRTATTLTLGATRYPLRSFLLFDVIAGLSWAVYSVLVGHIGGTAFEQDPLKGLLLGLGIAVGTATIVELVRYVRKRRSPLPENAEETETAPA